MQKEKQLKYDKAYLRIAREWSKLSHCKRKQVGAVIVKDRMIISDGYNGTPSGFENFCEDEEGYTKWYVLHAEITMSPCKECSKLIHQAGITRLVYCVDYKDNSGLDFLKKAGVDLIQITQLDD